MGERRIAAADLEAYEANLPQAAPPEAADQAQWHRGRLQALIDREILLLEARALELDRDDAVRRRLSQLETAKLASLMDQQETGGTTVSQAEVQEAFAAGGWRELVETREIFVVGAQKAASVSAALQAGGDFDELASEYCVDRFLHVPTGEAQHFVYSPADRPAEVVGAAFSLAEGSVSLPIPLRDGYVILRVDRRRPAELGDVEEKIRKVVQQAKEDARREAYLRHLLLDLDLRADPEGMDLLLGVLSSGRLEALAEETGQHEVYGYGDSAMTVREAAERLLPMSRNWPEISEAKVRQVMRDRVLPPQVMALDARRRGVEASPAWQQWRQRELEKLMLIRLRQRALDGKVEVSEEDLVAYHREHAERFRQPGSARILELLVEDGQLAQRLAEEARAGSDLGELIRQNGARETAVAGTLRVYGPQESLYGEQWMSLVMMAPLGQIQGPIRSKDGYSVFQVLDRQPETVAPLEYPRVREAAERSVREELERETFNRYMAELRQRYDAEVTVYDDNLERWAAARITGAGH